MKPPSCASSRALLAETSDEWETGKIYLNMENQNPALSLNSPNLQKKNCAALKTLVDTGSYWSFG